VAVDVSSVAAVAVAVAVVVAVTVDGSSAAAVDAAEHVLAVEQMPAAA